jgi:hypothetical protein
MWMGLCLALILIGSILVGVWSAALKRMLITKPSAETLEASPSN